VVDVVLCYVMYHTTVVRVRIRITTMFLGLTDPDPLVQGTGTIWIQIRILLNHAKIVRETLIPTGTVL
jgi:hypothetical protein